MRTSTCSTPCGIAVLVTAFLMPCRSSAQQPGPPPRQRVEFTGVVLADGVLPSAGDTVQCALNRPGATGSPRAVTDAQGRFRMVIDSATAAIPDQMCFLQLWREGRYRSLAPKGLPQLQMVLFGNALWITDRPYQLADTLVLKPD